jgi:sterol desaturase/sphingolipid hydroxylase (fatty acid hydroxylase superfamily)
MTSLIITLFVPAFLATAWLVEARWPARPYVAVRGWARIGAAFFVVSAAVGSATPWFWSRTDLASSRLLHLDSFGWFGLPIGVLITSAAYYAWHRAAHRFDVLWRTTHQLHHSALRVDVPGAFFTHPLEVVAKSTLGFVVGTVLLGLHPAVASMTASLMAMLSILQHWNIHTPRWLGYLVPRPEMHAMHHEAGVHGRNYGDLPLWDLVFGTFFNPQRFDGRVGFDPRASGRIADMLQMRDVNRASACAALYSTPTEVGISDDLVDLAGRSSGRASDPP